jgi:hypothetical protein
MERPSSVAVNRDMGGVGKGAKTVFLGGRENRISRFDQPVSDKGWRREVGVCTGGSAGGSHLTICIGLV